ncbi:hypothetical protein PanWU01x14_083530 [Parasponia andersonii]|uniref:Uncharacterized protein n=1 Tax=Parasponia andersonii TaxID=3476 RepID=A0A2P5DA62_PARAD|nr:hypothetical protein PanWU01x14_083530 [Parasponia andersonii]
MEVLSLEEQHALVNVTHSLSLGFCHAAQKGKNELYAEAGLGLVAPDTFVPVQLPSMIMCIFCIEAVPTVEVGHSTLSTNVKLFVMKRKSEFLSVRGILTWLRNLTTFCGNLILRTIKMLSGVQMFHIVVMPFVLMTYLLLIFYE